MTRPVLCLILFATLLLSGCGGGESQTAVTNLTQDFVGREYSGEVNVTPNAVIQINFTPRANGTLEGQFVYIKTPVRASAVLVPIISSSVDSAGNFTIRGSNLAFNGETLPYIITGKLPEPPDTANPLNVSLAGTNYVGGFTTLARSAGYGSLRLTPNSPVNISTADFVLKDCTIGDDLVGFQRLIYLQFTAADDRIIQVRLGTHSLLSAGQTFAVSTMQMTREGLAVVVLYDGTKGFTTQDRGTIRVIAAHPKSITLQFTDVAFAPEPGSDASGTFTANGTVTLNVSTVPPSVTNADRTMFSGTVAFSAASQDYNGRKDLLEIQTAEIQEPHPTFFLGTFRLAEGDDTRLLKIQFGKSSGAIVPGDVFPLQRDATGEMIGSIEYDEALGLNLVQWLSPTAYSAGRIVVEDISNKTIRFRVENAVVVPPAATTQYESMAQGQITLNGTLESTRLRSVHKGAGGAVDRN